ncbi:MAG TPA: NAD-dependent DNA ligase LigA [Candidatus Saccharimonadales bacterium]|nr:NAD-dependent DNA ligase LigA [Candidatus Saccharimonadales bacterium]
MTDTPAERAARLRELINDYRYNYHVLNKSIMSEAAADSLKHELSQIEAEYPELITPDSPTQRVAGEPLPGFSQIRHSARMLSLNDVFNEEEFRAWVARITKLAGTDKFDYFVDLKMDGLACALVYQDGVLAQGITRGDGFTGEDVTANIRTIESVPLRLRRAKGYEEFLSGRTEIRGEIIMYKDQFARLNEAREKQGLPKFANPRNLAAGTIRQLDPRLVAARPLQFHAYDLLREDLAETPTNEFIYKALRELGLIANSQAKRIESVAGVLDFARQWEDKRKNLAFNTDGLVVKVNDRRAQARLGVVGKAPRGAVAYKYPAEQATTKVKDIFVSIGRTGSATPVAMLEPVVVAGSTVQMATLHNESEVHRKDIRVGDTVIVQKAGDIIPEVVEPLVKLRDGSEKKFVMPAHCPDCGTKLVKAKAEEAVWRCPNNACPSRSWKQIQHYASKEALDIDGLGEKNVIALLAAGLVNDSADLYKLKKEDALKLERFAEISAGKLVAAIQAKRRPTLARFLYGLGIRHIGVQTAIDLASHFHSIDKLAKATIDELSEVEGIGEVVAEAVVEWFAEPANQKLLEKFGRYGVEPEKAEAISGPLAGKNFVVTGSLESMSREQAAERIRNRGGTFQSSVGKETDYLVVGANVGAGKLVKAQKLGTKRITEAELIKLLD